MGSQRKTAFYALEQNVPQTCLLGVSGFQLKPAENPIDRQFWASLSEAGVQRCNIPCQLHMAWLRLMVLFFLISS